MELLKSGIYAVVSDVNGQVSHYYKPNDYISIYDQVMKITNNNHELSEDVASWCELACIGEEYETDEVRIEIMEID